MATLGVKYKDTVWKTRHRVGQKTNKALKKALKRVKSRLAASLLTIKSLKKAQALAP